MKEITLNFDGYYKYENVSDGYFAKSGVYCVYAGKYNQTIDKVSLRQLLYIGEGGDVLLRLSNHEKLSLWKSYLQVGETLWISVAFINSEDRERAEAACIFEHQPICNNQCTKCFNYEDTKIVTSGGNSKLKSDFIVKKETTLE